MKPVCSSKTKRLTRSSCPRLICAVPQLGSLIYVSSNIVPQDEVNLAEFRPFNMPRVKAVHLGQIIYLRNISF